MDRADGDLVDFLTFDLEVVDFAGHDRLILGPSPGVMTGAVGAMEPDRLEPGMTFGNDSPLLGDLALEPVGLGA